MRMLCQDVIQLVCVHGLVPVEQPYASHSTVLANLHNIVIACRHRFLAAQGGLEALSALDAQVSQPLRVCGHLGQSAWPEPVSVLVQMSLGGSFSAPCPNPEPTLT
jgi:hypothetical protein